MTNCKKIICFILTVLMLCTSLAVFSTSVAAYDDEEVLLNDKSGHEGEIKGFDGGVKWSFNKETGKLTLSGYHKMYDYTVFSEDGVLPPWYHLHNKANSVTIKGDLSNVGNYALYNFSKITSVKIPDSVTFIGVCAFEGCKSLKSVKIPQGVTTIETGAFEDCDSLTSVSVPKSVTKLGASAFASCEKLQSVNVPEGIELIDFATFSDCESLETLTLPESVTGLGESAFDGCKRLRELKVGKNIKSVGCDSLKNTAYSANSANYKNGSLYLGDCLVKAGEGVSGEYEISEGTSVIATEAFTGNKKITSVKFPDSLKTIGENAFKDCTALANITLGSGVECVKPGAFQNTAYWSETSNWDNKLLYLGDILLSAEKSLKGECVVKDGTRLIADNAFFECAGMTGMTLPPSIKRIGVTPLDFYGELEAVRISDIAAWCAVDFSIENPYYSNDSSNPVTFGGDLYVNGKLLTKLVVPEGVEIIGNNAFASCRSLKSVTLPKGVKRIERGAFAACDKLKSINFPNTLEYIDDCAFSGCESLTKAIIPDSVKEMGDEVFDNCGSLTEVRLPDGLTKIDARMFCYCDKLKNVNIPDGVTLVGDDAFRNCKSLTAINLPKSVEIIGENAFNDCNKVESLSIPSGVTKIGEYAFCDCRKLTKITVPKGITKLEPYVFYGCEKIKKVTIPRNVKIIGEFAFSWCEKLNAVKLCDTLEIIDNCAFDNCEKLKKITVPASVKYIGFNALGYLYNSEYGEEYPLEYFSIYGEKGSAAETYAKKNSIPFNKKPNPAKYVIKTKTVKISAAKLRKVTVKPLTVKGAKGKVNCVKVKKITDTFNGNTYTVDKSSKAIYDKVSVNRKTGAVTFAKGNYKKGTYKLLIKVKTSGSPKYGARTVIKKVKIKFK